MRIAQITDLHMRHHLPGTSQATRRLSRRMPDLFTLAIDRIAAERPDLVVCTGDILDYPFSGFDDPELRDLGARDYALAREILDRLPCPYVAIHGNHDHPDLVRAAFADQSIEDAVVAGHRVIAFHDDEVSNNVPRRLLADRERFVAALADAETTPQIHVQHFLVWPRRDEGYPHTYREAESIREAIVTNGRVRMVLSGHYHPGIAPFREGDCWFAAGPAFAEAPHRFRIYDLNGGRMDWREVEVTDPAPRRKVAFFDRDGVITRAPSYRWGPERIEIIPGAGRAIARLRAAGFAVVTISNQSAVGLGYVTPEIVGDVFDRMVLLLRREDPGAEIDGIYCSYDHPHAVLPEFRREGADSVAKPAPGLLVRAIAEMRLDAERAYMVGDCLSDLQAGRNADARTALIRTGHGREQETDLPPGLADYTADDLAAAVEWIIADDAMRR